jgi:hypothetical protein
MAQDPEESEELVDPSHDLDMVPLLTTSPVDGEVETEVVRSILDASGIPSILTRAMGLPSLGFELRVPRERAEEARRVIEEQRAAGPAAAEAGEAAEEEGR